MLLPSMALSRLQRTQNSRRSSDSSEPASHWANEHNSVFTRHGKMDSDLLLGKPEHSSDTDLATDDDAPRTSRYAHDTRLCATGSRARRSAS